MLFLIFEKCQFRDNYPATKLAEWKHYVIQEND